jgi:hypothetical protein
MKIMQVNFSGKMENGKEVEGKWGFNFDYYTKNFSNQPVSEMEESLKHAINASFV